MPRTRCRVAFIKTMSPVKLGARGNEETHGNQGNGEKRISQLGVHDITAVYSEDKVHSLSFFHHNP